MNDNIHNNLKLATLGLTLSDLTIKSSIFANQLVSLNKKAYRPLMSLAIDNQISAFNNIGSLKLNLPKIDEYVSPMLNAAREATLSISELVNNENILKIRNLSTNISSWFNEVLIAGQKFSDNVQPFVKSSEILLNNINTLIKPTKLAQFSIQSNLAKISELSIFAENYLSKSEAAGLGAIVNINNELKININDSFLELSAGYKNLFASFGKNLGIFANFNPHITRLTSEEYFNSANLLESISIEGSEGVAEQILKNNILIDNERGLSFYLQQVNRDLINLWNGSKKALASDNPDRIRHFGTSLRELFTQVIHALAPNNEIKLWTSRKDYFKDGNPTRKARLNYICRNISNETFEEFIDKDITALLALLDLFENCTHEVKSKITEIQLLAMQCRAESTIKYLITISKN
jgi:hypothetical protein